MDVGAADIDGENRIVGLDHPRWQQVSRANETGLVRMIM
jgi:hypothetical protein